jgi:hypothetical protein
LVILYAGGDGASGDYATDVVSIGGAVLSSFEFGIMYNSTIFEGVIGVSFQDLEFQAPPQYPNLPVALVTSGYIASRAFSLYTNNNKSAAGSLLFGGIDTDKYCGNLVTIPLVSSAFTGTDAIVDFTIPLLGVAGTSSTGTPVIFSGT